MPADYESTARALALPVDDEDTEPLSSSTRPSWHRRTGSLGQRRSLDSSAGYRDQIVHHASSLTRRLVAFWRARSLVQQILLVIAAVVTNTLLILFLVFNEKIFHYLAPYADRWREVRGGWLVLWFATFIVSFPPLIGYSSLTTISGFIYGFPNGWFVVASATVVGSTASFIASRYVLTGYVHRLVAHDTRFAALSLTLKHDGLKLLCMIRLCPLPYSLSNGAIATVPTVNWYSFALATAFVTPKLFIHVFIGSRLAAIGEGGMDAKTKALNWASVAFGLIVGALTGVLIWRRTQARARELEAKEVDAARGVAPRRGSRESGSSGGGGRPGAGDRGYSDDPAEQEAYDTLREGVHGDAISLQETPEDGDDASGDIGDEYRDLLSDASEDEGRRGAGDEEAGFATGGKR